MALPSTEADVTPHHTCVADSARKHVAWSGKLPSHMERSYNMRRRRRAKLMSEPASHLLSTHMNICTTELVGSTVFIDVTVASLLCAPARRDGSSNKPGIAADVLARHTVFKPRLSTLAPFVLDVWTLQCLHQRSPTRRNHHNTTSQCRDGADCCRMAPSCSTPVSTLACFIRDPSCRLPAHRSPPHP